MFLIFINYTQFLYLFLHSSEVFSLHPISQLMIYPLLCQSGSHSDSISLNHTKMNLSVTKLQTYSFEDPLTKTFFTLWCMTSVKYSHVNYSGVFNLKFLKNFKPLGNANTVHLMQVVLTNYANYTNVIWFYQLS